MSTLSTTPIASRRGKFNQLWFASRKAPQNTLSRKSKAASEKSLRRNRSYGTMQDFRQARDGGDDRLLHSDHLIDDKRAQDLSSIPTPTLAISPSDSSSTISLPDGVDNDQVRTVLESSDDTFSFGITICHYGQINVGTINKIELILRYAVMFLGSYFLGVYNEFIQLNEMFLFAQITSAAWLVCLLLKFIATRSSLQRHCNANQIDSTRLLVQEFDEETQQEYIPAQSKEETFQSIQTLEPLPVSTTNITVPTVNMMPQHHPELEDLYVMDKATDQRIQPNGEPLFIDNELFSGYVMIMVRTSDADTHGKKGDVIRGSRQNMKVSNHFEGKKRRFEIQFQINFKQVPESQLCFGTELDDPVTTMGIIQRAFVGATMKFVRKSNPGFHYNILGDTNISEKDIQEGNYEKAHMTFTCESSLDVILATKPNETPPKLGEKIYEDPKSMRDRCAGTTKVVYNTEDTYTFALWSAYVDFIKWKCVNLPAIRPFDLNSVMGNQSFSISVFLLTSGNNHNQSNIKRFISYEFGHKIKTKPGQSYKKWLKNCQMNEEIVPGSNASSLIGPATTDYDSDYESSLPTNYCAESSIDVEMDIDHTDRSREPSTNRKSSMKSAEEDSDLEQIIPLDNITLDVPAWIEIIHRSKRQSQRAFVIRAHRCQSSEFPQMRLRTKEELESLLLGKKGNLHAALNTNTKMRRNKSIEAMASISNSLLAGELAPFDKSCYVLSELLGLHSSHSSPSHSLQLLSIQLSKSTDFDRWFLRGKPSELGLVASKKHERVILSEGIVARCLWESRWREEVCLISESSLDFYSPLSRKPFTISHLDIQLVRRVNKDENVKQNTLLPLPGLKLLAIETAWRCHYIAFVDDHARELFQSVLDGAMLGHKSKNKNHTHTDVWKAHIWQDFQPPIGGRKWANLSSSKKSRPRVVLNDRRMAFDCEPFHDSKDIDNVIARFVEDLLGQALSISLKNLEVKNLVAFLDNASRLRKIPLKELDMSGRQSFCIFVNIYHCLLQHALITNGPPTKKSIGQFMLSHCYEIGQDVFSLAELESCVIRGNMSKPVYSKPPFVTTPSQSREHLIYALGAVDPRINFLLNHGDVSKPSQTPILTVDKLEEQLNTCSTIFLRKHLSVDLSKKIITLPKVCQSFIDDFGGSSLSCAHYCLKFLDKSTLLLIEMCNEHGIPTYKFRNSCDDYHSILSLQSKQEYNEIYPNLLVT